MAQAMGRKTKAAPKSAEETFVCLHCGKTKKRSEFYVSRDPAVTVGIAMPCKECAKNIARNYNPRTGTYGDVTPASLQRACEYLDVPFIQKLWDGALLQVQDETHTLVRRTVWDAYIKDVNSLKQYSGMRWRDGDLFKQGEETSAEISLAAPQPPEALEACEKNKNDIIRLVGYDPFDKESDADKPLLYAQLIGYIDTEGNNDDMTRILDSIEIVRGYLQLQKLNDMSAKAFANLAKTGQSGEIKSYMETKKRIADVISQLAEQSCISLKHNKNQKKGENTWTGKIKKLKELNLREAEVNGFDIGTCRGMQQVLEMSDASIMKQLRLDESEWSDMVAEQRQKLTQFQNQLAIYKEINRILLRENLDLRDTLEENNILNETDLQNLKQLFSAFGDINVEDDVADESSISEVKTDG